MGASMRLRKPVDPEPADPEPAVPGPADPQLDVPGLETDTCCDGFLIGRICLLGDRCDGVLMISCFSVRVWYVGGQVIYDSAAEI